MREDEWIKMEYLCILKRIFVFRITQVQFVGIICICILIEVLLHLFRNVYNYNVFKHLNHLKVCWLISRFTR